MLQWVLYMLYAHSDETIMVSSGGSASRLTNNHSTSLEVIMGTTSWKVVDHRVGSGVAVMAPHETLLEGT